MSQALSNQSVQPVPTPEESLEAVFLNHGHQKEVMVSEYIKARQRALEHTQEEVDKDELEFDVNAFLSSDEAKRQAAFRLATDAVSPVVSRETQMAVLKQLIQDFFRGKKRVGLSTLTVLKAVELLNKMTGYEAPQKVEVEHDHKINVFPVISEPFKGELEPLKVVDVQEISPDGQASNVSVALSPTPPPDQSPKPDELFP